MSTNKEKVERDKLEAVLKSFEEDLNVRNEKTFDWEHDARPEDFPKGLFPEELKNEMAMHLKEIENSVAVKNADILNGRMEPPVSYDDGDQSPVLDDRGQHLLRIEWATYVENFFPLQTPWMSDWSCMLFLGDYQRLEYTLKHLSDGEINVTRDLVIQYQDEVISRQLGL